MGTPTGPAARIAYPRLTAPQIDLIISILWRDIRTAGRNPEAGPADDLFAYLTGFYLRRWGTPPALTPAPGPDET